MYIFQHFSKLSLHAMGAAGPTLATRILYDDFLDFVLCQTLIIVISKLNLRVTTDVDISVLFPSFVAHCSISLVTKIQASHKGDTETKRTMYNGDYVHFLTDISKTCQNDLQHIRQGLTPRGGKCYLFQEAVR